MLFQARFAHLKHLPDYKQNDVIPRRQKIGTMGNTGKSSANHVHFDLIQSETKAELKSINETVYRLYQIPGFIIDLKQLMEQYNYFLDEELFKIDPVVTSYFGDPFYPTRETFEFHPAFDIVPINRHETERNFDIYWNRSMTGRVEKVGFDKNGYGNYICISYGKG